MIAFARAVLFTLVAISLLTQQAAYSQSRAREVRTNWPAPRQVDERRMSLVGIRKLEGKHLRLYTDLPVSEAVDDLPQVFDAAVEHWADYFQLPRRQLAGWRVQAFLIEDRTKFAALGLLPERNRDFVNGYAYGYELWLDDQPSDYYRRHLLLHEGVHSFMLTHFGSAGPGWYMEGMAEILGTHRWQEGQLETNILPASREEVPLWGRIRLIRDAHQNGKTLPIEGVLAIDNRRALDTDAYAWCWSLCKFLDSHPKFSSRFRELRKNVGRQDFNSRFRRMFQAEWSDLNAEWDAFVATLDYGYDIERMTVNHTSARPVEKSHETTVAADRGWQSSGWLLQAGKRYKVTASGRFQIAADPEPWPSESGGVTLRYHEGHPLGMLLGALRPVSVNSVRKATPEGGKQEPAENVGFANPFAIGLEAAVIPEHDAILYLRVNDSAAELADNQGSLRVEIARVPANADDD